MVNDDLAWAKKEKIRRLGIPTRRVFTWLQKVAAKVLTR